MYTIPTHKHTVSSDVGTVCTGIGCQGRPRTNICVGTKQTHYNDPTGQQKDESVLAGFPLLSQFSSHNSKT